MARIKYRNINFRPERLERIVWINKVIDEYKGRVSVRQVYYRLVVANLIPNVKGEYDKIQNLMTEARYAGLLDWASIEDRNRESMKKEDWKTGRAALDEAMNKFRFDRWQTQPYYVELWCEKAALEGILWPVAQDYHVTLMTNRGYSSATKMKESADRIRYFSRVGIDASFNLPSYKNRPSVILYLGDHDPSGNDMVRDIRDRLAEFDCPRDLDVQRIAITREQVEEYKLPPNPLKRKDDPAKYSVADGSLADGRAEAYIAEHGEESWEVDALPPKVLELLVRTTINSYIDKKAMQAIIAKENLVKKQIKKFIASFKEPA